jgi:hypothetical protein
LDLRNQFSKPDLSLAFLKPARPMFYIVNESGAVAKDPKYQFLIYDLDVPGREGEPALNLMIPVKTLDFVRAKDSLGPWAVQELADRGDAVQAGHHVFGYAQVTCPDCAAFKRYWLYAEVGKRGWYASIAPEDEPKILKYLSDVIFSADKLRTLEGIVPPQSRVLLSP